MTHENMHIVPIEDVMGERFGRYSKYIIQERALPDVRDGLKPVQRRILYAMHEEGNTSNKPYRKSAKTVGIVIGNYHPHGDSSVYDAMVRLSQSWKVNMPLVDMQGNNGSVDDDPAAAMRYTEARLAKISERLLEHIDEDTVPFVLNFDDMTTEPSVLPAQYPNLLVNGASGIAAGYATNIPPFNLSEIVDATIYRTNHPDCSIDELMGLIQGPDFPTGAIIQGKDGIKDILRTGKGRIVVRSKVEIVKQKTIQQIVITELPFEVIKSNLVRKIDDLRYTKASEGFGDVLDVRDESDRNGLRIVIDCRKNADVQSILNLFYKHTELQIYYNANMVSIINKTPVLSGVDTILDAYIDFRKEVILNRTAYRLGQKEKRLHILEGLMRAMSIVDEIIRIIRSSDNRANSRDNLMLEYGFSKEQASAIVDLQLYRLSSTDIVSLRQEHGQIEKEVLYLKSIIEDKQILTQVMIEEFYEVKNKFAIARRSVIENEVSELEVDHMNLIPDENFMVTLSKKGYIKKVSLRSYGSSAKEELTLMDEDTPVFVSEMNSKDNLLFITDKGKYGLLLTHEIEEARWKEVGSHMNQYMRMDSDESITNAFIIKEFLSTQYIVTTTQEGLIKKTSLDQLEGKRIQKLYDVMSLGKEDRLVSATITNSGDDLIMVSQDGMCMRLNLLDVNPIGLKAKGIIGMRLKAGDSVAGACSVGTNTDIVINTNRGAMKRIKLQDIPLMNRATQGLRIAKVVKSNPYIIIGVYAITGYLSLTYYSDTLKEVQVKDIPIMDTSSSYSNVISESYVLLSPDYRLDIPDLTKEQTDEEVDHKDIEPLQFDV